MTANPDMLQNLLMVAATQFVIGGVGLMSRRNLFHILLSSLIMLQGLCVAIAAVSSFYGDVGGMAWLFVVWGTAVAVTAVAAIFFQFIARRRNSTDIAAWRSLRESEHDPLGDRNA